MYYIKALISGQPTVIVCFLQPAVAKIGVFSFIFAFWLSFFIKNGNCGLHNKLYLSKKETSTIFYNILSTSSSWFAVFVILFKHSYDARVCPSYYITINIYLQTKLNYYDLFTNMRICAIIFEEKITNDHKLIWTVGI